MCNMQLFLQVRLKVSCIYEQQSKLEKKYEQMQKNSLSVRSCTMFFCHDLDFFQNLNLCYEYVVTYYKCANKQNNDRDPCRSSDIAW